VIRNLTTTEPGEGPPRARAARSPVSGNNLLAGTDGGAFLSTNNGTSWTVTGLTQGYVNAFAVTGADLFAGTLGFGVFLSTNNGTSWTKAQTGLTDSLDYSLAVIGTNLFCADGVWRRPLSEMIPTSVNTTADELSLTFNLEM